MAHILFHGGQVDFSWRLSPAQVVSLAYHLAFRVNFLADNILKYFSYFSKETGSNISCKLSPVERTCMKIAGSSRPYFSLLFLCSYFSLLFFSENVLLSLLFSKKMFEVTKNCNFFPPSLGDQLNLSIQDAKVYKIFYL